MKINYTIYNIRNMETCIYSFMSWDYAEEHNFNINDYEQVWNGEYDTELNTEFNEKEFYVEDVLEHLYEMFNSYRPEGYKNHSMSVSDVVELKIGNFALGKYYCDSFDWVKISN